MTALRIRRCYHARAMVRITVNGRPEFIGFPTLSYEQIIGIVNERRLDRRQKPYETLDTVVFAYKDYSDGMVSQRSGTLTPGQCVPVQHEMSIVALATNNA